MTFLVEKNPLENKAAKSIYRRHKYKRKPDELLFQFDCKIVQAVK